MKKLYWVIALVVLAAGVAVPFNMNWNSPGVKPAQLAAAAAVIPTLDSANPAVIENPPKLTENTATLGVEQSTAISTPFTESEKSEDTSSPVVENKVEAAPAAGQAEAGGGVTTTKSKAYEQIAAGPGKLMNNVWGVSPDENSVSGIYTSPDGSFGWYWNRQSPQIKTGQSAVLPIYPSIRVGGNCLERLHTAGFPLKLGDAKSLTLSITYKYTTPPTGSYDLAYDIFLSEASQPDSRPKITAEVMIWLDGTAKQPARHLKGEFSDGKNIFDLYSWVMGDGRAYYSFILKGGAHPQGSYTINAGRLLEQINLDPNLLLHGVEFGNEVYNGAGQIQISQFDINVNGQTVKQ